MPDPGPTSERLEALRDRWRSEPGSRVFLQLADEYRRLGRTEEAARVLEQGLQSNPGHVGAQVALGRCRLELGSSAEAAALLERAVESDPTQMVAYRLLVDAYLEQGRAEEARQRLRIYSLLNDADPEIAELRRRIGELDHGGGDETAGGLGGPEGDAEPEPEPEPEPRSAGEASFEALSDFEAPSELDAEAESWEAPAEAPSPSGPAPLDADGGGADGEPFPALAAPADRRRYLEGLRAGGLFELDLEAEEEALGDEVFDLEAPAAEPPDLASLLEPGEAAAEAPAAEPPPEPGDRPTVTLGRLYLRQGHLEEAEAIFREVLAREPGNAEALRHLEELTAPAAGSAEGGPAAPEPPTVPPSRPPLGASELLEGLGAEAGVTERKRHVLERYLERIRGRTSRDVH